MIVVCSADADAAKKKRARAPQPDRFAAIVMEADTGLVISEKNPDRRLYPASLTKMMTLYLTFEAIDKGRLRKSDRVNVSSRASMQEPSKLGLRPGSTLRVEDGILGLVTKSANDAAVVLAEAVGGSEANFGRLMTQKARALGMNSTQFINASGLHNPNQYSTARDMALLSQALIRDFPREYRYFSTANFVYGGVSHRNHNRLMSSYQGMDGLKTGYVYASGYNLAASAKRSGKRLIGVVFGGKTAVSRNQQMARLLDDGFNRLRDPRIIAAIDQRRAAAKNVVAAAATPRKQPGTQLAQSDTPPAFDAIGLVTEQGDTSEGMDSPAANRIGQIARNAEPSRPVNIIRPGMNNNIRMPVPKPIDTTNGNTRVASAAQAGAEAANIWSVQIGAFATQEAGLTALKQARNRLPQPITSKTQYVISPLMTNRGMIYRARLSGLGRDHASDACRILTGNCLVMAAQLHHEPSREKNRDPLFRLRLCSGRKLPPLAPGRGPVT